MSTAFEPDPRIVLAVERDDGTVRAYVGRGRVEYSRHCDTIDGYGPGRFRFQLPGTTRTTIKVTFTEFE